MRTAFDIAGRNAPGVLLFEDLDRVTASHKVSMSSLLNTLDGLESREGVLVLATSNAPEKLDPALLHRPSRFDRVWQIGLPELAQRLEILRRKGGRFFTPQSLEHAAGESHGFSMAYTQEIITNAVLIAANTGDDPRPEHLLASLDQLKAQFKGTAAREGLNRHTQRALEIGFQ